MRTCVLVAIIIAKADGFALHFARRSSVVMKGLGDDGDATRDSDGDATRDSDSPVVAKDLSEAMSNSGTFAEYVAKRGGARALQESLKPIAPESISAESAKPLATVSPLQGVVAGGGTLGILGAAVCTSTGSPPSGLAVAFGSIAFMAIGAKIIESKSPAASPSDPQRVPTKSAKPPANLPPVVIGGTLAILALSFALVLPLPSIELPSIELPSMELPTIELPSIELPSIELDGVSDKLQGISTAMTEALRSVLP